MPGIENKRDRSQQNTKVTVLMTPLFRKHSLELLEEFEHWLSGNMGVEELKPAHNDYLQRWRVSKRVNSSKADKDDASLIERVELATA